MKKLKAILQPLKGRGIRLRIEYKHKLFLSGSVGSMSQLEKDSIKANKCFIINIVPIGKNYTIAQILESLERMINYSDDLGVDAGYEMHSADLKALSIGYYYLESLDTD